MRLRELRNGFCYALTLVRPGYHRKKKITNLVIMSAQRVASHMPLRIRDAGRRRPHARHWRWRNW